MKKKKPAEKGAIQRWAEEIGWANRVRAVCKPCWELKYCPYGPLVEDFPLKEKPDERSCRIFGHDCPVFTVAEPFTETKALRRISRHIPRPVQLRVLKRDNQICALCRMPVLDQDIHFDHLIPWSKGGSSDEHNIRLLCGPCNRKRGNSFEAEHLVKGFTDHVVKPIDAGFVDFFLRFVTGAHEWKAKKGKWPDGEAVTKIMHAPDTTSAEHILSGAVASLDEFFNSPKPSELTQKLFGALKERWGFDDGNTYYLAKTAAAWKVDLEDFLNAEVSLFGRLGWHVKHEGKDRAKWLKT